MTLLLNSCGLVLLLVGICAEMNDISFEFMTRCDCSNHYRMARLSLHAWLVHVATQALQAKGIVEAFFVR